MLGSHLWRYISYLVAGAVAHPAHRLTADWWDEHYRLGALGRIDGSQELPRYLMVAGLVAHHAPSSPVLDVGCGVGTLLESLRAHGALGPSRYVGVDLSRHALAKARERWGEGAAGGGGGPSAQSQIEFIEADSETFPLSEQFGAIIFSESLYYSPDPRSTILRYAEALRPGGVIIVSMWRRPSRRRVWRALARELTERSRVKIVVPRRPAWDVVTYAHSPAGTR